MSIFLWFRTFSGQFLITFIQLWQDTLNDLHHVHFEFNTYIISVLVIFFLQVNYNLPTVKDMMQNTSRIYSANDSNFKPFVQQFFHFYGNNYQIWNHVISPHIGQWQERRIQAEQTNFSEAKKQYVYKSICHIPMIMAFNSFIEIWYCFLFQIARWNRGISR